MGRVQKNVVSPGKTGWGRIQAKVERKTLGKVVRKDKQRRQEWRQSKEGSNVTFTDVQRLFMKLMKGANEEDWNLLVKFERDDYTRIYDHKMRSVYKADPYLGRGETF